MPTIVIGRLDDNKRVDVLEGCSVLTALEQNGFNKDENEVIQDISGNEYEGTERVENGKGYFLVSRVKSGC